MVRLASERNDMKYAKHMNDMKLRAPEQNEDSSFNKKEVINIQYTVLNVSVI